MHTSLALAKIMYPGAHICYLGEVDGTILEKLHALDEIKKRLG